MKPFILSLVLLLTTALFASAQKSDYVITTKGDTAWCHISNPLIGAMYYKTDGGEAISINTNNVSEYYLKGKKQLSRAVFIEKKAKLAFLVVTENGPISLYQVVQTSYDGTSVRSVKNLFIGKKSNHVTLVKTTGLVLAGKSRKDRKDELAGMLKDKKAVYETYVTEDKFSFKQIENLVHWYNTGEKI